MLVRLNDISKIISNQVIFFHTEATINEGERIGVVGINGAGKSTLLRIITGEIDQLESGTRDTKNNLSVGILEQNASVDSDNTVYDEMRAGAASLMQAAERMREIEARLGEMQDHDTDEFHTLAEEYSRTQGFFETNGGYDLDARIEIILAGVGFAELDRKQICSSLSGGEKTRLALARLLLQEPELLLLDEPTNHLDFDTIIWLEKYLETYQGTILVVSHDRKFLDGICTKIWEIAGAKIFPFKGNYSGYMKERIARYNYEMEEYQKRKERMAFLADYVARNKVRASTAVMARSRQHELDKMMAEETGVPRPPLDADPIRISLRYEISCGKDVLMIEDMSLHVNDDPALPLLCQGLNLHIRQGERVAIVGANGVGKSTFLKAILRQFDTAKAGVFGAIRWGINVRIGYFAQDDSDTVSKLSLLEELLERHPTTTIRDARNALACLGFRGETVEKPIWGLSGGEMARLKLVLLMYKDGNVIVVDEPTNHLDIPAKEAVERALCAFEGTVIVVSHDRYFLNKVPTRVVELFPDRFEEYPEGFAQYESDRQQKMEVYFEELRGKQAQLQSENRMRDPLRSSGISEGKGSGHRSKQDRAKAAADARRLTEVERRIAQLEEERGEKQRLLEDPGFCRDAQEVRACCQALEELEIELGELMEVWVELTEEKQP